MEWELERIGEILATADFPLGFQMNFTFDLYLISLESNAVKLRTENVNVLEPKSIYIAHVLCRINLKYKCWCEKQSHTWISFMNTMKTTYLNYDKSTFINTVLHFGFKVSIWKTLLFFKYHVFLMLSFKLRWQSNFQIYHINVHQNFINFKIKKLKNKLTCHPASIFMNIKKWCYLHSQSFLNSHTK